MKTAWKGRLFLRMMVNPLFLIVYGVFWFHLYSLCQFGRVAKNIPVLLGCAVFFLLYLIVYVALIFRYQKNAGKKVLEAAEQTETGLCLKNDTEEEQEILLTQIRQADFTKKKVTLYLSHFGLVQVALPEKEKVRALKQKLPAFRRMFWKYPVLLALLFCTGLGMFKVYESAVPYNGKLAWYLSDLQDKRTVTLQEEHKNIYETGVEGFFEDVQRKVKLPEKLCLTTSFNLHFLPDGTIDTLDTMLYGYDNEGNFVNSYLITYDRKKGDKISVYLNGAVGKEFDETKDIQPLIEAVSRMDLENTLQEADQPVYGILYYGVREWNSYDTGLVWLNEEGQMWQPDAREDRVSAYSISLFCPKDDMAFGFPIRYLYDRNAKKPEEAMEPEETQVPEFDLEEDVIAQLKVFAQNNEQIAKVYEEFEPFSAGYTVFDLDGDGRLELITTINVGTGRFSCNHFFHVNDAGDGIVELEQSLYSSYLVEFDLNGMDTQAFESDGRIYYAASDWMRDGIHYYCQVDGAFYLEDNQVFHEAYRMKETSLTEEEDGTIKENVIYYEADGQKEISEKEYEAREKEFWQGKTPMEYRMEWVYSTSDELQEMSETEVFIMLAECYSKAELPKSRNSNICARVSVFYMACRQAVA